MNVVLVEPQIPQNTGNIARLCAATKTTLHLVGKLGFKTDNKHLKRAGLDYWDLLDLKYYDNFDEFSSKKNKGSIYLLTTKGKKRYCDVSFKREDYIVFGSETDGLPVAVRDMHNSNCLKIPIVNEARSLNLSNSVGIVLYEALRQNDFFNYQPVP